ncbi:1,4-beta-N-acetylmuramidase [Bifidobacterium tissieri]|uniref:1,4-beta-N-acetylmuramidase n=1 Tax=Bifidobacterium tissieri TaxID=1630162 RepID=A0A261FER9_9BIFI|nr:RICIN domain-containing protein [Bifidobacterium tissieri]OZG57515.1 1,4-beta-N-acetylmuramidase [Bifidobacterium tissieri]
MSKAKNTDGAGRAPFKVIAALCAVAMGAATAAVTTSAASAAPATVQTTQSASVQTAADQSNEELEIAPSGLPSKTAPFDQTIAYFLWPYQWGTQNVGDTESPKQSALQVDRGSTSDVNQTESASGNAADEPQTYSQSEHIAAGEYGWKGPGTRPTEPNLKSLDAQLKLVKESGMTYVKTSYLISPLNAVDPNCDQSVPGDCAPSTDLPDQIIQRILDAGLKPVVYFSQGNPDPKAVSNPDPHQVYKTVPSFTKDQVKDTISDAIQKFANKGIIWEAFNEPESEEHWPGGNNKDEAKIQWIELDQFIGDTIRQYDPNAAYVWGNFSGPGKLNQYQNEMKAAHATALSGHGYWISSPENPLASSPVGGYDFMDSEFGCSAGNTETSWSCGFNKIPKDSNLQGIWLIRQLLVKDIKGLNLASPYRMVGYDSFSINEDNDPANPGDVKTTEAYNIIKDVTLALKGYSYVDGSYQNADGVYRAIYRNKSGAQKLVYWTADKPTLDNDDQTKDVTINFENQDVRLTAKAVPQVYETPKAPQEGTYLTNLTAWKTTDGQVIQAHGGSVLKDGDTFYWVGQGAPDNVPTDYNGANGVFANQWLYTTINMYKSKDLVNWQFANAVTSIDDPNAAEYCDGNVAGLTSKVLNYNDNKKFKDLVTKHPQYLQNSKLGCKIERPHILKNAKTGKYLIWAHWEGTVGYGSSQLIAFQSDTVDGKYQPLKWQDGQVHAQPKVNVNGKLTPMASRDLSAWADPDTGKAYIVSSTEKVRLYRLNDDYTGVDPDGSYEFPNIKYREAPSLFKENGRFYMITSAQDYWDPTQTEYASTSNIEDPNGWTNLTELQSRDDARKNWGNQDSNTRTYIGQPTYVLQYQDANNKPAVMLLADDWNPLKSHTADVDTTKANYVMTPVKRLGNNQLSTPFQRTVVPMGAGQAPSTIVAVENPDAVTTAMGVAPVLPTTVKATWSDKTTTDEPVTWDAIPAESYAKPGSFEVKGKAAGLDVTVKVTVENAPVSVEKLADVTTNVGNVAQLPKTAKVTWADGTTTEEAVDWSSVDSQKFFTIGTFTATGKVKGLDAQVAVNVTLKDGTYVIATAIEDGSRVVDMTGASKAVGARAQLYTANGTMAQRYKFKHLDNGNYTIKNVNSGLFLAHGNAAGDPVTQQKDEGKAATQWQLAGTDSALTIAASDSSLALDLQGAINADGTPIQIFDGNSSEAQQWKISGAETPRDRLDKLADEHRNDIADGTYKFAAGKKNAEVLDVAGGSRDNGANVQIYSGNGTDAQAWTIKHDADGYLTITNAGSGKVLDVAGGSTNPGANVQQYDGNGTWAQKWIAVSTANGFKIQSAAAENLVLDIVGGSTDDGANVQIYSSNDSSAQRWRLKKTTTTRQRLDKLAADHKGDLADGTYEIASTAAKQMRFDVVGGSADDGANVQLYEGNGTNAQAWKVSHDKNGYVTLTNVESGKVLDISNASSNDGANVQQWSSNGSLAQKWVLVKESNGSFTLHSALREDFVIDAAAGGTSNGTNIQMWTSNNSVAQHWAFNKK